MSLGAAESTHAGFSGAGYVNYDNVSGSYVQWSVSPAAAGAATVRFRYANGTTVNRPMAISVNGAAPITVDFPATGAWPTWATATATVDLAAGPNRIRATAKAADGGPNVDYLELAAPA